MKVRSQGLQNEQLKEMMNVAFSIKYALLFSLLQKDISSVSLRLDLLFLKNLNQNSSDKFKFLWLYQKIMFQDLKYTLSNLCL